MHEIAQAGGGGGQEAIDWHFESKADLFNATMECITLPMAAALHQIGLSAQ